MEGFNDFLRTYWPVVATILGLLMTGGIAMLLSTFITKAEHTVADRQVHKRISVTQKDVAVLNEAMDNMPKHKDFTKVYGQLESLTATMAGLRDAVTGMGTKVDMLIENEIKGDKN